ncbi:response regulator transcription factor [Agaribacterium haliotis]|uniref:response regulator transcription factor n=1 Tax=Agaribacterium haliotis TaxID=2013869 RepID=UPI000BB5875B|nr:response regulator transcription factor [Agaribacterium haliotis]
MEKSKVLLVEDDYAIMRGLRDSFSGKGYEVSFEMEGPAALQTALTGQFDLILLDLMLPLMNGFEICAAIREADIDTPIIMLTAKGEEESVVRGLNLGADDYVIKPFSMAQLHARCSAFIRRYKQKQPELYTFAEFQLDLSAKTLMHKQRGEIKLTPKEYNMLAYFLKKDGQALTRQMLLNAVWHSTLLTTARSVDRCVNTLRGKIEDDSRRPRFLLSVRDVGYRFSSGAA